MDDAQIASLLRDIFPVETDKVGLLGRMNRTLRTAVTTVLKVSRDTGRAIVSYGYELAELTRNRIAQLRIPERLDELVKAKQAFTERFYRFKGGKAVKVVLTIAVSMGGLATALTVAPVAGVALSASSLGLSLIDP